MSNDIRDTAPNTLVTQLVPVSRSTKIERMALTFTQKVRVGGIATAWGALGEAAGRIIALFVQVDPASLAHGCAAAVTAACMLYLMRGRPITLKDCLISLVKLRAQKLISREEYEQRRQRCLEYHAY